MCFLVLCIEQPVMLPKCGGGGIAGEASDFNVSLIHC